MNTYCYSKILYKCASIPLRVSTIGCVTTQARAWLLQDCFEKPSALVLHRDGEQGGLGLYSVKFRALAMLIRTFLELSAAPQFQHSLYLKTLYRTQVLREYSTVVPALPPYYDEDFFSLLRHYHKNSPYIIENLRIKDWYRILLQDKIIRPIVPLPVAPFPPGPAPLPQQSLMPGLLPHPLPPQPPLPAPPALQPVHAELVRPTLDWPAIWKRARRRGLPPDLASHMFRQLHGILPTQERIARFGGNRGNRAPGMCRLCLPDTKETLLHSFYTCQYNRSTSQALLRAAQLLCCPGLTEEASIYLDVTCNSQYELPLVTLLAAGFKYIWECRMEARPVSPLRLQAELSGRLAILRSSSYSWVADLLSHRVQDFPT